MSLSEFFLYGGKNSGGSGGNPNTQETIIGDAKTIFNSMTTEELESLCAEVAAQNATIYIELKDSSSTYFTTTWTGYIKVLLKSDGYDLTYDTVANKLSSNLLEAHCFRWKTNISGMPGIQYYYKVEGKADQSQWVSTCSITDGTADTNNFSTKLIITHHPIQTNLLSFGFGTDTPIYSEE